MRNYLSIFEVADLTGLTVNTLKGYRRKGLMPPPDAQIGRNQGWRKETIVQWQHSRGRVIPEPADD